MNPLEHAAVLLRSRAGLKAEPASRARLERLLHEGANLAGIPVDSCVDRVDTEPGAFADLLDRVTVQHSSFFRDSAQFVQSPSSFAVERRRQTIWCAARNGQEPYSLSCDDE